MNSAQTEKPAAVEHKRAFRSTNFDLLTGQIMTRQIMTELIQFDNTPHELTMSSREIAELLGKRHDNIKVSAERLAEKGVIGTPAMQGFTHNGNAYTEYLLNKRDSLILVAQNCPEFTARIIDRWQELETQAKKPAPELSRMDILKIAMEAEQGRLQAVAALDQATAQLTIAAPKALDLRPKDLFAYLQQEKWIYRRVGGSGWVGYQARIQSGCITHKVTTIGRSDGTEKAIEQVLVTPKGLAKLAMNLNSKKAA